MAEYHLTSEVAAAIRRDVLKRILLTGSLLLIGGFCYSYFILQGDFAVAAGSAGILIGVLSFSYFRNVKQQQALAASYRLHVTPAAITRMQAPLPTIQLLPSEVTSITQNHAGVLTIATADKYRAVYVPAYVANRDALLHELAAFAPLTVHTSKTQLEKFTPFAGLLMMGLMGTFYFVANKVVSTISGVAILGILAWSAWHIWRNPNLTPQIKRLRWLLPLVFLSILASVAARLLR